MVTFPSPLTSCCEPWSQKENEEITVSSWRAGTENSVLKQETANAGIHVPKLQLHTRTLPAQDHKGIHSSLVATEHRGIRRLTVHKMHD